MRKDNQISGDCRITRARAALLCAAGQLPPLKPPTQQQEQKRTLLPSSKRAANEEDKPMASDATRLQPKRRAVLKDVTNVCCENSYKSCLNAKKVQGKKGKQNKGLVNFTRGVSSVSPKPLLLQPNSTLNIYHESVRIEQKPDVAHSAKSNGMHASTRSALVKGKGNTSHVSSRFSDPDFRDIDSDEKDPQLCSIYAPDIYSNLRVAELVRRPYCNLMETTQHDITQSMRGILVDWLVEVSEEYKFASDTLYLTVHLIDWFLSKNFIERQKLQLLGITCMLIASKYEEICVPRVEQFCFITDNTYTRDEVLKMETQVLRFFGFQISTPTVKPFLRRFLRAAQAANEIWSLELEYLANYLAELTLVDYSFLNFVPSLIAASAVFLSRWTLDQSTHPWASNLVHYTNYMASDMKTAVLAMQDLQLNTNGCPLHAIRMKYRQEKFKSVAALTSPKLLETVFEDKARS